MPGTVTVRLGRLRRPALLLAAAASLACRPNEFPGAPVILISVDTLRADHLPAYGYTGVATPNVDALRRDSILFESAFAHAPLTLPSHASMLTGLLPAEHGVRDNAGFKLKDGVDTLPSLLGRSGYATGAAVSSVVLSRGSGIARGFQVYEDLAEATETTQIASETRRAGTGTARLLTRWISGVSGGPFFAFLHLYEPHAPYDPPEPFRSRYPNGYDAEVAAADEVVGELIAFLQTARLYDRAVIVFTSDHGEGLGEHGEMEHGMFLYRTVLHVPLLLKLPGSRRGGSTVGAPVGLADLFPTLTGLVGLAANPAPARDISLLDAGRSARARRIFAETLYPRLHFGWSDLASLADERWHYIHAPRPELYDMKGDPGERKDVAAERRGALAELRSEAERLRAGAAAPSEVDAEHAARLASLGYISGGVRAASGALPDPKDRMLTFQALQRAVAWFGNGEHERALEAFRKILEDNPGMLTVWRDAAESLVRLGRPDEAIRMLERGIAAAPPGSTSLVVAAAELELKLDRLDAALARGEEAARLGDPTAETLLARIHLARGELDTAEALARSSLAKSAFPRVPYFVLARVALARSDPQAALARLDEAAKAAAGRNLPPMVSLHHFRGDVLRKLGRASEAADEYREEIRLFPSNLEAYVALATLCKDGGRPEEARRVLSAMVSSNRSAVALDRVARASRTLGDAAAAEGWLREGRKRYPGDPRFAVR